MDAIKGPWNWKWDEGDRKLYNANGRCIMCDTSYYPWTPQTDEEWSLIAAAPEMFEALQKFLALKGSQDVGVEIDWSEAFDMTERAIRKVGGG